ncbi:hypothetical protein DAPPUDRAFT_244841 [Daphnia pulex]|uniref:Cuticular protein n=1 Tax=Daphnia pulex TaxID=6669 RepID=E9GLZ9_DAPPU|nr:hypothetical protein DAPPUDRAFT_244841 [Daphnia pulex]|eukprot:EFX79594.1 hypothetical protein DAPPUDRAFT_244841 [Daphnia pulex]
MKTSLVILVLSAVVAAVVAQGEYAPPALEKKYDGYFQYANVPSQHEYEFGYNRGNDQHRRNHYEQSKDMRFRTKVKWDDSYGGNGEHYWEYNHSDNNGYKAPSYDAAPAYAPSAPAYAPPSPAYSQNYPVYEEAPSAKL